MAASLSEASLRLTHTQELDKPVASIRFVAGARKEALERMGVHTVRDLLLHIPLRYLDYTKVKTIAETRLGDQVTVLGIVDKVLIKRPKKFVIVEVYITDSSGVMRLTYFRQPWIVNQIKKGDILAVSGKVEFSYGFKGMQSPFHEKLSEVGDLFSAEEGDAAAKGRVAEDQIARELADTYKMRAIYPLTKGITNQWMRRIVSTALTEYYDILDYLPADLVDALNLIGLPSAYSLIHFPHSVEESERARRRLAFDELFCLQIALRLRHTLDNPAQKGYAHALDGDHYKALHDSLPFKLSQEQKAALADIKSDMSSNRIMNRLLLGDVGTGKTVVAALSLALVADSHTQSAVMVPTSVLAQQYAQKVGPLLESAGVSWALLVGSTPKDERDEIVARVKSGEITVLIGTHALLSEDIVFKKLSLVVVDEQHRFGVEQRAQVLDKGEGVDVLAMTATPIPRTLALSLYGDTDVSRIKTRPIEGAGVTTKVLALENLDIAFTAIRKALAQGQQAYLVTARIDDTSDDVAKGDDTENTRSLYSAVGVAGQLSSSVFPEAKVAVLTGSMSAEDKDRIMGEFHEGKIDILVATTVIEVGVDVPNATVMLVYDADRFGLATLHQLRGRVGRGTIPGQVYLVSPFSKNSTARERLDALEKTSEGDKLAELDLKIRHEGDILGLKQSGLTTLSVVDVELDDDLIQAANSHAKAIMTRDPELSDPIYSALKSEVMSRYPQLSAKELYL